MIVKTASYVAAIGVVKILIGKNCAIFKLWSHVLCMQQPFILVHINL